MNMFDFIRRNLSIFVMAGISLTIAVVLAATDGVLSLSDVAEARRRTR